MNELLPYGIVGLIAIVLGFILFKIILNILPSRLKANNLSQKKEMIKEARKQKQSILASAAESFKETQKIMEEDLEEAISQEKTDLKEIEKDLEERHRFLQSENERLKKLETEIEKKKTRHSELKSELDEIKTEATTSQKTLIECLEKSAKEDASKIKASIANNLIEKKQLEAQKLLKSLTEDLDASAVKKARRILDSSQARYTPNFAWPKAINTVEITKPEIVDALNVENSPLIEQMKELSGSDIQLMIPEKTDRVPPMLRVVGGFGINKESARLTLAEIIPHGPSAWDKAAIIYKKYNNKLEAEAAKLGKKAVNELKLPGIHPEVQRLIGALNWRTSYRQNQWHHTVEVAKLAGIVATELNVDPDAAKRVGLLHDIGKAIDYRIEGSHAVISGDYADRYGEEKYICDTVMSHHSDIVVETPLAYILRVADTLSGGRPGARVNLEEGYQIRLGAIAEAVRSFPGVSDLAIMNGGREVHIGVNNKKVKDNQLEDLVKKIARKIEEDVAFPGQIKVLATRQFESVTVA